MTDQGNSDLVRLLKGIDGVEQLSSSEIELLGEVIEDGIATKGADHLELDHRRILSLVEQSFRSLPKETRAQFGDKQSPASLAFKIGQIAFAQVLLGVAAKRRAPAEFSRYFREEPYSLYVDALTQRDMTNTELAHRLSVRQETVSRKLKDLREAGVIEFRKVGAACINFLTPAARSAAADRRTANPQLLREEVAKTMQKNNEHLPEYLRSRPSFSFYRDAGQASGIH